MTSYKNKIDVLKENVNLRLLLDNLAFNFNDESLLAVEEINKTLDNYNIKNEIVDIIIKPTKTKHYVIETKYYVVDVTIRYIVKGLDGYNGYKNDYIFNKDKYYEDMIDNGN